MLLDKINLEDVIKKGNTEKEKKEAGEKTSNMELKRKGKEIKSEWK